MSGREVNGAFDFENIDSTYDCSIGKVVCFYNEPLVGPVSQYQFLIEAEVRTEVIVGKGFGDYSQVSIVDESMMFATIAELYLSKYSLNDVTNIWAIDDDFSKAFCANEKDILSVKNAMAELNSSLEELEYNNESYWAFILGKEMSHHTVDEYSFLVTKLFMLRPDMFSLKMSDHKSVSAEIFHQQQP